MRLARNEIEQQGRDNPGIVGAISAQFSESGALLRQAIDSALDALDAYIDNVLRPHADVPRQLEEEGEGLRTAGASTEEIAREMGELLEAESWEGEAADAYKAAATVQHKATQELAGVMLSGGAALQRSADLNLATFFVVAERTRMARRTVDVMARLNRGGPQPYARTQLAAGQLRRLLSRLQDAVASIAEGEAASELAGELDALADLPNLLAPLKWPTGTDLADQTPAETGSAITRE